MNETKIAWLQWIMVILVLVGTLFLAIINNQTDIVFNLCTLCFGYYFGSSQSNPPAASA